MLWHAEGAEHSDEEHIPTPSRAGRAESATPPPAMAAGQGTLEPRCLAHKRTLAEEGRSVIHLVCGQGGPRVAFAHTHMNSSARMQGRPPNFKHVESMHKKDGVRQASCPALGAWPAVGAIVAPLLGQNTVVNGQQNPPSSFPL